MVKFKNAFILAAAALLVFAGAAGAAQATGAVSFSLVAAPAATTVGGVPVNMTIQVLDAEGNVNVPSSGQAGDVLFSISSSLGTEIYPAGRTGESVNGGVGTGSWRDRGGSFAAINEVNIAPKAGLVLANISYDNIPGTDQVTVRMYNAVSNGNGDVVAGDQIGAAQTFTVNVAQGTGITSITDVALTNSIGSGTTQGDDTGYYPQEQQVAGADTVFQVTVPAGQSGDVTVNFVGINKADAVGNNAFGTTVTADVTVNNGSGTGTATFTKAGLYEIRATANDGNVTFTKTDGISSWNGTHTLPRAYAVEIFPADATALKLSTNMTVVTPSTSANATVTSLDEFGNASANPVGSDPITVTISGSGTGSITAASASITAGWATGPTTITGATEGNVNVTATATGLTDSAPVAMIVAATPFTAADIDDGAGLPASDPVVRGVGQTLKVINITATGAANPLVAGQPVILRLGSKAVASTLVAAGSGVFSATFTLPTSTVSPTNAILEAGNGAVGSVSLTPTIAVVASAGATVSIVNANGFPITSFDADNTRSALVPDGRSAGRNYSIPPYSGGRFVVQDAYGNDVTSGASGLTGTLTSSNVTAATNNALVDLGSDVKADAALAWPASFSGTDTVTLTPIASSGIPAITFDVTNIGTSAVTGITITPAATQTLANSIIPFVVTTTGGSGSNDFIISLEASGTLAQIVSEDGQDIIPSGSTESIGSRGVYGLATGNTQGTVTIQVKTLDGKVVGESSPITVSYNTGLPVGSGAGIVNFTAAGDQKLQLQVNTTNTAGETPAQTWFVFTATHAGQSLGLFLLTNSGIVPLSSVTDFAAAQYDFGTTSPATIATLSMADLGLTSGDTFTYAYAYSTTDVSAVNIENVVTITVQ